MGKSAKITRGGNKKRVNEGRQEAKLAAATKEKDLRAGKAIATAKNLKDKITADTLKALQKRREEERSTGSAVAMLPRSKPPGNQL